jgi:hypothetical protein
MGGQFTDLSIRLPGVQQLFDRQRLAGSSKDKIVGEPLEIEIGFNLLISMFKSD